ncbi:unnamed protein product, partial [Prorocentrum cordatum]
DADGRQGSPRRARRQGAMCQSAAAFGAGLWVAQRLGEVALPAVRVAAPEGRPFKLRVRVHSVSAAGLEEPGLLARQRPRVEVVVGGARKETELGDLQRSRPPGAAAASRPAAAGGRPAQPPAAWGFGETLTFSAGAADVLGAGSECSCGFGRRATSAWGPSR